MANIADTDVSPARKSVWMKMSEKKKISGYSLREMDELKEGIDEMFDTLQEMLSELKEMKKHLRSLK